MIEIFLISIILFVVLCIYGKLDTIEKKINKLPQITEKENLRPDIEFGKEK